MSEYDKSINEIKEKLDKAKNLRIRAEARIEQLNRQRQDLLKEMEELGVKPEELDNEIKRLREEIEGLIRQADEMLPSDLL